MTRITERQTSPIPSSISMRWIFGLGLTLAATLGTSCESEAPLGCAQVEECPAGYACNAGTCEQICSGDTECAPGQICSVAEGICTPGRRSIPEITGITGNSSQRCVANEDPLASGPLEPCVGSGFVVTGNNLLGATFTLAGGPGLGTVHQLSVVGIPNANAVEVSPGINVQEGVYRLVATNQSGSSDTQIKLLRGEPGPAGAAGAGSGTLYHQTSNDPPQESARTVSRYRAVLSNANPEVGLDGVFNTMCADDDGCTFSMGVTHYPQYGDGVCGEGVPGIGAACGYLEAPFFGRTCRMAIKNNVWAIERSCNLTFGIATPHGEDLEVADRYVPYFGQAKHFGVDADDTRTTMALYERLCVLSDGPSTLSPVDQGTDANPGFHFFMIPNAGWADTVGTPAYKVAADWLNQSNRSCVLVVED